VGFRTPPADSTGVPHILEHSALSGSKKYPIKDVFSELVKGSMTTFLNAMTYSDKTIYPFSTRNEKEYFNLMDVYLDLTLSPILDEDTFLQEGWHYHLTDKNEEIKYNGIVLNEMKGAYSDPIRKMWEKICYYLLPDSTYSYSSGGYPENIVELTYQQFLDFHKRYYHPSNSAVVLYGNADLQKELKYIDENYLSKFDYDPNAAVLDFGKKITEQKRVTETYPAVGDDSGVYLGYGIYTGEIKSQEDIMAMEILTNILFNSDASPLKDALMKAKVGTEIGCIYNDTKESFLFMYALGSSVKKQDKFVEIYNKILSETVQNGIDRELLISELNSYEFMKREEMAGAKRGMEYTINSISSLFYDVDVHHTLESNSAVEKIRKEALENKYFEKLIEKYLLNNPVSVLYTMVPDKNKAADDLNKEKEALEKLKNSLGENEIEKLVSKTQELLKKQAEPNSEENLKLLPKLSVSDIKPDLEKLSLRKDHINGIPSWITENLTQGISYVYMGFKTDNLPVKYLPYLNLFSTVFTEIGTTKRSYIQLAKDLATYTGGFGSDFDNYSNLRNPAEFEPVLWFQVKTFNRYLGETFDILNDIFTDTRFDAHDRLKEIIERTFSSVQYSLSSEGYHIALLRLSSYLNDKGRYNESVQGYTAYESLKQAKQTAEKNVSETARILKEIAGLLIQKNAAIFHINSEKETVETIRGHLEKFSSLILQDSIETRKLELPSTKKNEAFSTSADVVFTGISGNIAQAGIPYSGKLEVLKKLLDREYLYGKIRVQGGAYGNFSKLNRFTGEFSIISYRDPHVKNTYEAYKSIPDFLRNLNVSEYQLDQIKISAYAGFDTLMSAAQKGVRARNDDIRGITRDDMMKTIGEILSTRREDLIAMADAFEKYIKNSVISTIGNDAKIRAEKDRFSDIIVI
jgi:hypothetical protein